jgi:hypothetical protein
MTVTLNATPTNTLHGVSWKVLGGKHADYAPRREAAYKSLLTSGMNGAQLNQMLVRQAKSLPYKNKEELDDAWEVSRKLLHDLRTDERVPPTIKGLLDTVAGAPLVRQDLDPILHALYVQNFPGWDRMKKVEANGLSHAFNQITSPDGGAALGSSIIPDLATVNFYASGFARKTAQVAEFAIGRGVGLKELGAVRAGGAPYDVVSTELANGMTQLARDAQFTLFTGNASNSSGTASNEGGFYNQFAFDGWRSQIGQYGTFSGNNAIAVDQGSLNLYQSIKNGGAQAANNGGHPTAAFMSYNAKEALDIELAPQQRYPGGSLNQVDIIPGVRSQAIPFVDGELTIIPCPGTTLGQYANAAGVPVEDVYVIDEARNYVAWLFAEGWTVLQLPIGYSNDLSERFIVFGLYTLVVAAPLFNAKVRRPVS